MKKKSTAFDKFAKRKSNAAIKEQFKQEKRKWKKEREDFFEKKRSLKSGPRIQQSGATGSPGRAQTGQSARQGTKPVQQGHVANPKTESSEMPLNKFIAHCGVCSRRDAAEMVKLGKVKVNDAV